MAVGVIEIVVSGVLGIIAGIVGQKFFTSDCRVGTGNLRSDSFTLRSRVPPLNMTSVASPSTPPITLVISDSMFAAAKAQRDASSSLTLGAIGSHDIGSSNGGNGGNGGNGNNGTSANNGSNGNQISMIDLPD